MSLRALEFAARAAEDGATSKANAEYKMHENCAIETRTDVYRVPATEVCRRGTQIHLGLAKQEKSSAAPEDFLARCGSSNKLVGIPLARAESHKSSQ